MHSKVPIPFLLPSPLQSLDVLPGTDLWMKRDDLIHPIISGNKWRKLKGFFDQIARNKTIVTFGGAHSNHLPAAALAAKMHDTKIIGVVRGEELHKDSNEKLHYCHEQGMQLHFISRSLYRTLRDKDWQVAGLLPFLSENYLILPEGGAGVHSVAGCGEIWTEIKEHFTPDHLIVSSGTGSTAYGILSSISKNEKTRVHVISAVRGATKEMLKVCTYADSKSIAVNWVDEAFGGFGKSTPELRACTLEFHSQTGIQLDANYNAKLWYWLQKQNFSGRVVWINTGGF
jgi:1-aminocyclopropane-1-carboxylate deaminase